MPFLASLPPYGLARDAAILAAIRAGRIDPPTWIRVPVADGLEVEVSADYLTIDDEHVPMPGDIAQAAVDTFDALLPTPAIVDAIERAAALVPLPTWAPEPGHDRREQLSAHVFALCEERTRAAFAARGVRAGQLVAGHRKDVVLGPYMPPGAVVIYGARWPDGHRLQPLHPARAGSDTPPHEIAYADYSHGVRAVRRTCWTHGAPTSTEELYTRSPLGPVAEVRYAPRSAPTTLPAATWPTLRRGSEGPAVQRLQQILASRAHAPIVADGVFGPKTDAAVRAFQAERGLALVDGIVGPTTWEALDRLARAPNSPVPSGLIVDVSQDGGIPDYQELAASSGVTEVIVRLGSGVDRVDRLAAAQIVAARGAGLLVRTGYVYLKSWEDGERQAAHFVNLHRQFGLALWVDVEPAKPYDHDRKVWPIPSDAPSLCRPVALACFEVLRASGIPWGVYGALYLQTLGLPSWLASKPLWAATYGEGVVAPKVPAPWSEADVWQYQGDVPVLPAGVKVDLSRVLAPGMGSVVARMAG